MVVATGTALLIGGAISAVTGAMGAHQAKKDQKRLEAKQAAQYEEAKQFAREGEEKADEIAAGGQVATKAGIESGFSKMADFQAVYANWAEKNVDEIAFDLGEIKDRLEAGGISNNEKLALAQGRREGYLQDSLGFLASSMDVVVRDQERARVERQESQAFTGTTGTASQNAEAQALQFEGDSLARNANQYATQAAGLTETAGRDIMGINMAQATQDWAQTQAEVSQANYAAQWMSQASEGAAQANLGLGKIAMQKELAKSDDAGKWAILNANRAADFGKFNSANAMGVQHTGPTGPNEWQAVSQAAGNMDWSQMPGVGVPGTGPPAAQPGYGTQFGSAPGYGAGGPQTYMPTGMAESMYSGQDLYLSGAKSSGHGQTFWPGD